MKTALDVTSFSRRRWLALMPAALSCPILAAGEAPLDLQGHRGARGLAPENTLAAFRRALTLGVSTLELDTGVSADGVVMVAHDTHLNPAITRDANGQWLQAPGPAIHQLSRAELQRYDVGRIQPGSRYAQTFASQQAADGERMPTLAQVFELVRDAGASTVRFNIETKLTPLLPQATPAPQPFVQAVLEVVRTYGMERRVTIQSFDWRSLRVVQAQAMHIPTVALTARQSWLDNVADVRWTAGLQLAEHESSVPRLVRAGGFSIWSPYFGDLTAADRELARQLRLPVVPWTVNLPADIERLLEWQVDGLISDYPDRVRDALAGRRLSLPPAYPARS